MITRAEPTSLGRSSLQSFSRESSSKYHRLHGIDTFELTCVRSGAQRGQKTGTLSRGSQLTASLRALILLSFVLFFRRCSRTLCISFWAARGLNMGPSRLFTFRALQTLSRIFGFKHTRRSPHVSVFHRTNSNPCTFFLFFLPFSCARRSMAGRRRRGGGVA